MSLFSTLKAVGTILLCSLVASAAMAGSTTEKPFPEQIDRALKQLAEIPGFSCEFIQVVRFSDGADQRYSGTLSISRPGRFHWKYQQPYEQLYVSDGSGVWHYETDLMQAEYLQGLDTVDPVAMKLLDGRVNRKDVELLGFENAGGDGTAYRVTINSSQELLLGLTKEGELRWIESEDVLGNRNRILFINVEKIRRPDDYFNFVPPKGVDVINVADSQLESIDNN